MAPTISLVAVAALGASFLFVQGANVPTPTAPGTLKFHDHPGQSTKVYNVSAAKTTLSYKYTNEELAMLWNQVGKIEVGPITTTVSPTPEPTAYARPGLFHPEVCSPSHHSVWG